MSNASALTHALLTPPIVRSPLALGRDPLPLPLRRDARLSVLDATEWFGETSGGIRTYLLQKAAYVAARPSLRHVIVVPGERDAISEGDGVRMYRLQGPRIPRQRPYRFMLAARSIARLVQHEAPDLIEIGSPFIVPWIVRHATRDLRVPMVCFYHTNLPRMFAPRTAHFSLSRQLLYRGVWRYMTRLDALFPLTIVTSQYAADELAREGITRVAKVPLGVDLERFTPARRAHAEATRRKHGLPAGPLAACVGRFAREKELETVLDAWGTVERQTGARLALIGAGPMEATLRAHSYASRVTFVPFQSDRTALADVLAAVDVVVAPGRMETFGLASLEALASGTPVLSANDGGVAELVRRSGAGRTFVAGAVDDCAVQATALFADDLVQRGVRGRAFAEDQHSWDAAFDALFSVYRTVVAEHGVGR
ncbi:MAG: glycosyltransferase [Gemmatimonadaceae bacterium]|nr:glycosyltransferase [Gemmatimonadaceae bacterium]